MKATYFFIGLIVILCSSCGNNKTQYSVTVTLGSAHLNKAVVKLLGNLIFEDQEKIVDKVSGIISHLKGLDVDM